MPHAIGLRLVLSFLLLLLLLLSACGESLTPCEDSCQQIIACTGGTSVGTPGKFGWYCPRSACGEQASCEALCILDASCDTVSDKDSAGVSRLQSCMTACAGTGGGTARPPEQPVSTTCTPSCQGRTCGDDGCGGSCGTCKQSYLTCDETSGKCQPKTPSYCFQHNECEYPGQVKCTTEVKYRKCYRSNKGCFYLDCET
jgi:hypothetical protein